MKLTTINKLYLIGTTLWVMALAEIADFNPLENMTDLTGQGLFY